MQASDYEGTDDIAQLQARADEAQRRVAEAVARRDAEQAAAPAAPAAPAASAAQPAQDDNAPQNDAVQAERERDRSR